MKDNSSRRSFLKRTLALGGMAAVAALPLRIQAQEKVSEDDPVAQSMGYVHDAVQVDIEKFPKRSGEAGAKQFCDNCVLYQGGADDEWGNCGIFPGRVVAGKGWCNAWAARA